MNSGSAASVHDALLPHAAVASTLPIGTLVWIAIATQPHAASVSAIHTPPHSITSITARTSAVSSSCSTASLRARRLP